MMTYAMMTKRAAQAADLDKSKLDPSAVFATPKAVLFARGLSAEDKKAILIRWEADAEAAMRATEEGMPGPEPVSPAELLRAVHDAMRSLDETRTSIAA